LENLITEYEQRESLAAKCAKDADLIEQMYQEWVLMWQGNKLAQNWFEGKFDMVVPRLRTESAKQVITSLKESNPHEWWWEDLVTKNYNPTNLNSER
jgi:hypothetical protein